MALDKASCITLSQIFLRMAPVSPPVSSTHLENTDKQMTEATLRYVWGMDDVTTVQTKTQTPAAWETVWATRNHWQVCGVFTPDMLPLDLCLCWRRQHSGRLFWCILCILPSPAEKIGQKLELWCPSWSCYKTPCVYFSLPTSAVINFAIVFHNKRGESC